MLQLQAGSLRPCCPSPSLRHRTARHTRQHAFRQRCPRTVCASSSPDSELRQIETALNLRREEMAACAEREDYSGAAAARDAAQFLELRFRRLQLQEEHEARTTVRHRLGHLIVHRKYRYRGVIAGFTHTCEASESWCRMMRVDTLSLGRNQPFYTVLVDERDRPGAQSTYVAQENIEVAPADATAPIQHPLVDQYFTEFRDGQYEPKYTLKSQYPQQPS